MSIYDDLSEIQKQLNAPKNRRNNFGNYNYRSCEDIVEAVKKILPKGCSLLLRDEIVLIGDRYYVKAEARIFSKDGSIEAYAYARESLEKKGMDSAQVTGAASSYARKYALNGLFAIDDSDDIDAHDHKEEPKKTSNQKSSTNNLKSSLISQDQAFALSKLIFESKADPAKFKESYGIKDYMQLTQEQHDDAICKLKTKMAKESAKKELDGAMKKSFGPNDYVTV